MGVLEMAVRTMSAKEAEPDWLKLAVAEAGAGSEFEDTLFDDGLIDKLFADGAEPVEVC